MDTYITQYESFPTILIYDFKVGSGGIGDNIKFFMFILEKCMKNNTRLYYKKNNIELEKYLKLKHDKMYIDEKTIHTLYNPKIVSPFMFYSSVDFNYSIDINKVFYFTDDVKLNVTTLFPNITEYVSIHLRLGDKHLETEKKYLQSPNDVRTFSDEIIHQCIDENGNENIFFCCDNNSYKLKLKEKYKNIIVTQCDIGHTSLTNTTPKQILDSITEFYILTNSKIIFAGSFSGFSIIASKFNNIPLKKIY
jgi:hypothetical protein